MTFDAPTIREVVDKIMGAGRYVVRTDTTESPGDTVVVGPYTLRSVPSMDRTERLVEIEKAIPFGGGMHEPPGVDVEPMTRGPVVLYTALRVMAEDDLRERLEVVFTDLDYAEFAAAASAVK